MYANDTLHYIAWYYIGLYGVLKLSVIRVWFFDVCNQGVMMYIISCYVILLESRHLNVYNY